ncbi:MAG TPA: lysozyme inhibitor LprI family protein [Steroidobacteraceae bacterium]|jgi:uncharacterized protein YecT (DUF1311 family)|nr:lysozyme inhibitor LprI family protein [Steroidobacteraceae bacterium]
MRSVISVLFLHCASLASAEGTPTVKCNPGGAQIEQNICAYEDFMAADRALNQTYQALLRKEGADAHYVAKLRLAQKAWIAFRDAELEATFACAEEGARACWGSIYPLAYNVFKTRLTDERRMRLAEILEKGRPADGVHN